VVKPSFLSGIQPTHAQNATDRACARSAWVGAGDKPSSVGPGGFRVPLPGWRTCRRVRPFLCARACAWAGAVYPPPAARTGRRAGEPARGAVRPCTRWGLPCPDAHAPGGGLLPRRFTLAWSRGTPGPSAVCFLWHFPAPPTQGRVGVTHHRVLPCSDFPPNGQRPPAAACPHEGW